VIRAKLVLYAAQGLANDEIASRIDTARQIVSKWRKRFFEQGVAGLEELPRQGRPSVFSPGIVVAVKALACELPSELGIPLSRFSMSEIKQAAIQRGLVETPSRSRSSSTSTASRRCSTTLG
jgi:transposase